MTTTAPFSALATVVTDAPERYAKQLVSHLGRKIDFSTQGTTSTFALGGAGDAGGSIEPGDGVLLLGAHASTEPDLARVKDVLGRHLERFGERAGLTVTWQDDAADPTVERPPS